MIETPFRWARNALAQRGAPYGEDASAILNADAFAAASREIRAWPGYEPTPLHDLPGFARELDIGRLFYKDEGHRFGLKSFKALGGAYALAEVLKQEMGGAPRARAFGPIRQDRDCTDNPAAGFTVAAATDGNHGRSVAWAARLFGCRCVIFLHQNVSAAREREIARYGAEIRRVAGNYDDSVRTCIDEARRHGWRVIQDTALEGDRDAVPVLIMQGYQMVIDEAWRQMPDRVTPTHVFVPAGVGGLAAAVAGYVWERLGSKRPIVVVVEPIKADCVYRSIDAGRRVALEGDIETFMACLAAGEVSPPAWPILRQAIDFAVALDDDWSPKAMRRLARPSAGDPAIVAGESGAAAIAGLMAIVGDPAARSSIGLTATSIVLAIGSEGATDEEQYQRVVGQASADIV